MPDEGADLIGVGGESTRPGTSPVSADGEMRRVLAVIEHVAFTLLVPVSLDTTKSVVARAGAAAWTTFDADLLPAVVAAGLPDAFACSPPQNGLEFRGHPFARA